jgi:hypothetical protein
VIDLSRSLSQNDENNLKQFWQMANFAPLGYLAEKDIATGCMKRLPDCRCIPCSKRAGPTCFIHRYSKIINMSLIRLNEHLEKL